MESKTGYRKTAMGIRMVGTAFAALTGFGLSLMAGEWVVYLDYPFSLVSVSSSIFGAIGWILSELLASRVEKW